MVHSMLAALALAASLGTGARPAAERHLVPLPAGTLVRFRFEKKVKARKVTAGQQLTARLDADVIVGGRRVLPEGAPVTLVVTHARRAKAGFFRVAEGYLSMRAVSVRAGDGTELPVRLVQPIEAGTANKEFTWDYQNVNVKPDRLFLAEVVGDHLVDVAALPAPGSMPDQGRDSEPRRRRNHLGR